MEGTHEYGRLTGGFDAAAARRVDASDQVSEFARLGHIHNANRIGMTDASAMRVAQESGSGASRTLSNSK